VMLTEAQIAAKQLFLVFAISCNRLGLILNMFPIPRGSMLCRRARSSLLFTGVYSSAFQFTHLSFEVHYVRVQSPS
jgi:hypothetical protein